MIAATLTCITGQGAEVRGDLSGFVTAELGEIVRTDTEAWIKRLRAVPYDGRTMRERFTYRDDSLWWFTEVYLHKMRRLETALMTLVALDAACRQHAPARLRLDTEDLVIRDAAHTFGRAHDLPVDSRGANVVRDRHARPSYLAGLTATLSRLRPSAPISTPTHASVAMFVHSAFDRSAPAGPGARPAGYVAQVIDAIAARVAPGELLCIGVGPRRNFRRRRRPGDAAGSGRPEVTPIERFAPHGALSGALDFWRRRSALAQQIIAGDAIREAGRIRQYSLWPVLRRELEAVALLQWPWAARTMDEAAAAITAVKPDVVATYGEAGAWGRAVMLEARRRNVPTVGVPHELVAHHSIAYSHEPDEMTAIGADRGFPAPDRTLVFDPAAKAQLDDAGHFHPSGIVISGHPRSDGLRTARLTRMADADRALFRQTLGVGTDQRLAVLVARLEELGPLLPAIIAAATARPHIRIAVIAHPDDPPDLYASLAGPSPNRVAIPAGTDFARLLAATDGIITRESTVAIDALSIGVPCLVVGAPDHLGPLVDAGIMLGATQPDAVAPGLDALLFDDRVRKRLTRVVGVDSGAGEARPSGRAADRAAEAILEMRRHR